MSCSVLGALICCPLVSPRYVNGHKQHTRILRFVMSSLNITNQCGKTSQKEKSLSHSEYYLRHVRNCKIKELIISMGNVNAMSGYIVFMEN